MFNKQNVPVRINNVGPATLERDDAELTLLRIECEINPLSPELAAELDADVRARLFSRGDANVNKKIACIDWSTKDLGVKTQIVNMRMAPDQNLDSLTLAEAEVGKKIKTNQNSDGKSWRCRFTLTVYPASEHQSAQILESFGKVRYCSFEARQPDLFSPSTKQRAKAVRAEQAQGIGEPAEATH